MKLKYKETIVDCLPRDSTNEQQSCQYCDKAVYQTVVVSFAGIVQQVPLCGGHFIDAWADYPELRKLDASLRLRKRDVSLPGWRPKA